MPLADYSHWNEEAPIIWWQEEGRHAESDGEACEQDRYDAEQAYAEDLGDMDDDELYVEHANSKTQRQTWCVEWEIKHRGLQLP